MTRFGRELNQSPSQRATRLATDSGYILFRKVLLLKTKNKKNIMHLSILILREASLFLEYS